MFIALKGTLTQRKQLIDNVYLFSFDLNEDLHFVAGQYVILYIPHETGTVQRQYSIASSMHNTRSINLVVKIVPDGIASSYLMKQSIGDVVDFKGPAGVFTLSKNENEKGVFLLTGTGIAPFMSMLQSDLLSNRETHLYWGLRTKKDMYFFDELNTYALSHPQFHFFLCFSRESGFDFFSTEQKTHCLAGRITAQAEGFTTNAQQTRYYMCGNRNVIEEMNIFLQGKGILKTQITLEKF